MCTYMRVHVEARRKPSSIILKTLSTLLFEAASKLFFIYSFVFLFLLANLTQTESSRKRKPHLRSCLPWTELWACPWGVFLI